MEAISLIYKTKEQMSSFIKSHKLNVASNILIQAYCEKANELFIKQLQEEIREILPKATLIGSSVISLDKSNLMGKTLLIFSVLDNMNIKSNVFDCAKNSKSFIENELGKQLINDCHQSDTLNETYNKLILNNKKNISNKTVVIYVFDNYKISSKGFAVAKLSGFLLYLYTDIFSYSNYNCNNLIVNHVENYQNQVINDQSLAGCPHNICPNFTKEDELNELIQTVKVNKMALIAVPKILSILQIYGYTIFKDILNNILQYIENFIPSSCRLFSVSGYMVAIVTKEDLNIQGFEDMIEKLQKDFKEKDFNILNCIIKMNMVISLIKKTSTYSNFMLENSIATLNYAIKNKKNLVFYNKNMELIEKIKANFEIICKIKDAIKNDRIVPYFQPVRNNKTKQISGYESLIRLIDEKGKVYKPSYFLDIAKAEGLYKEIIIIMINKTFKAFENTNYQYSINLSTKDINDIDINNLICQKLKDCKKPENVVFELVESEGVENFEYMHNFIVKAKQCGAKIAIDDFGSGYSNLIYLMKLDSDYIKIDGSIIQNMLTSKVTQDIVKNVIDIIHNINQKVIAEYVEDEETQRLLEEFGADFTQGYYYGKPQPEIK